MPRALVTALLLVTAITGAAHGAPKPKAAAKADVASSDYARDQISVSTEGRSRAADPTATCLVWANAEGFGVGPAQLGGLHGVTLTILVRPLTGETPKTLTQGLVEAKVAYPTAPEWLLRTLAANQAAIETACGEDHPEPFTVHRIDRGDVH